MTKTTYNQKEREERVKQALSMLEQGVKEVICSENWGEYLKIQSKFHHYSFANAMLIFIQKPDAEQVAGYKTWESLGRWVKKGSKGIKILAPITRNIKTVEFDEEKKEEKEVKKSIIYGFKVVNVFDISQTDGKELPNICHELPEESPEAEKILNAMYKVVRIPVEDGDTGRAKGWYSPLEDKIRLSDKIGSSQKAKTFVHEYTHSLLDRKDAEVKRTRDEMEIVAESVAFVVCHHFGFNTSSYSFEYLASWTGGGVNIEKVQQLGEVIQKTATRIIDKISKALEREVNVA
jgi:antirestriction protein ArdC